LNLPPPTEFGNLVHRKHLYPIAHLTSFGFTHRCRPANGLRFTCAAKRSGAASGASACYAAIL